MIRLVLHNHHDALIRADKPEYCHGKCDHISQEDDGIVMCALFNEEIYQHQVSDIRWDLFRCKSCREKGGVLS